MEHLETIGHPITFTRKLRVGHLRSAEALLAEFPRSGFHYPAFSYAQMVESGRIANCKVRWVAASAFPHPGGFEGIVSIRQVRRCREPRDRAAASWRDGSDPCRAVDFALRASN